MLVYSSHVVVSGTVKSLQQGKDILKLLTRANGSVGGQVDAYGNPIASGSSGDSPDIINLLKDENGDPISESLNNEQSAGISTGDVFDPNEPYDPNDEVPYDPNAEDTIDRNTTPPVDLNGEGPISSNETPPVVPNTQGQPDPDTTPPGAPN